MPTVLPDLAPLLAAYDLKPPVEAFSLPRAGTNNRTIGVHTGAGDFVWKIYRTYDDAAPLRREARLLAWLDRQQLPFAVPAPVAGRTGDVSHRVAGGWQMLFTFLPGARPDDRNMAQIVAAGAALAELHRALARYPAEQSSDFATYDNLNQIHPAIPIPEALTPDQFGLPDEPSSERAIDWWRGHIRDLRAFLAGPYQALPHQLIHGDFALGNTLFHQNRLSALLDFEFVSRGARALDLASGLEFALRYWDVVEPDALWSVAAAFCGGYASRERLMPAEIAAIPWLIRLRDTVSALWHTGQALARGRGDRARDSFERLRITDRWLADHGAELTATIRAACEGAAPRD